MIFIIFIMVLFSKDILNGMRQWGMKTDIRKDVHLLARLLYEEWREYPTTDEPGDVIKFASNVVNPENQSITKKISVLANTMKEMSCEDFLDTVIEYLSITVQIDSNRISTLNILASMYLLRANDPSDLKHVITYCNRVIELDASCEEVS
jgi:hypothetical protein